MVSLPIYMDNNATTCVDPQVVDAMLPYFSRTYGNPGSRHSYGAAAQDAVDASRERVAKLINAPPRDIIFTSGATESNNLALKGLCPVDRHRPAHIVTTAIEHKAILDPCNRLRANGYDVTVLPVDRFGLVSADQVERALTGTTVLVSVMTANNEIGTIQPVQAIGAVCRARKVLFHTDAVQAAGRLPIDVEAMNIDLLSMSAHKLYGPKGIGALYVRRTAPAMRLEPLIEGGGQEDAFRSGTLAVPNIVGFGVACELCRETLRDEAARIVELRERLHLNICKSLPGVTLNGHPTIRLPGNLNLSFAGVEPGALGLNMIKRGIAVSSGSACTSSSTAPSFVLKALGLPDDLARSTLRFGIGRFNTVQDVEYVADNVVRSVNRLRSVVPTVTSSR